MATMTSPGERIAGTETIGLDRTAVVSVCSVERLAHLRRQLAATRGSGVRTYVGWLGDASVPDLDADVILSISAGTHGFRLAEARNAVAERAFAEGAELVIFLDADCVPGADLVRRYREAATCHPASALSGPVTYLPEGFGEPEPDRLARATDPHPARPAPPAGIDRIATDDEYALFWSLSFAVTRDAWESSGGFDERFEGYGAEDTDFGRRLRTRNVPLVWVGGADAYHQYHPTTTPPVQHLDDILRNGALFASIWGSWPMTGWLEAFERDGLVERSVSGWRRARTTD